VTDPVHLPEQAAEARGRQAAQQGQFLLVEVLAEVLVDVLGRTNQQLMLLVVDGQADAWWQLRVMLAQRPARADIAALAQLVKPLQRLAVALQLGRRQWQRDVLPYARAHRPYGQLLGMLDGEHADGDGGRG